jgi:hypothetical protein
MKGLFLEVLMNDSRDQAKPTGMPFVLIVIANHGAPH